MTATAGAACTQPGCSGSIDDGYCDVCGAPAAAAPLVTATPTPGAPGAAGAGASGASGAGDEAAGSGSTRVGSASQRLASAPLGSARVVAGSRATRRLGTSSTRMRGARLGAGITTVPSLPVGDPASALMAVPEVPEHQRNCPSCGNPVGRSRDGRPGRTEGFCPNCRAPYSFTPKLKPGDLVGGQYQVAGCLAHGGLGWVYLARDRNVSDRWVVLKGLLNAGDKDAYEAAIAERQFLAEVEHPLIVEIYNFVMHDLAGYIVMEYVGGTSLKQLLKQRMAANHGRYDPIPLDQAIAYVLEVLPAFQYLHDRGLLYCDFKPDNIIQAGDAVKLIDLGGVRRADDHVSAIYGTVGYQAPEVATMGPSVASDIYTLGRTLAVLAMEFRGYQSTYVASLPPVDQTPLFRQYDSYYRFLAKACAPDPADRFGTADEMRVQLLGVLREVVATDRGTAVAGHSAASLLFDPPVTAGATLGWTDLPALKVDQHDPQASWLATVSVADPAARFTALAGAAEQTAEVRLARARAAIEAGDPERAERAIQELLDEDPWEWRAVWMSGLAAMAAGEPTRAQAAFNAAYGQVPGELAPKLALARVSEESAPEVAEALYLTCARTDANYAPAAAFGLARIRAARKDVEGSLAALDMVPATSSAFVESRRRRATQLATAGTGLPALASAIDSLAAVTIEPRERAEITAQVLHSALQTVMAKGPNPAVRIDGRPCVEPALRDGLERTFRDLAMLSDEPQQRVRWVDAANGVRRWTLW